MPSVGELAQVDIASAAAAGDIVVRLGPDAFLLRMLVDRLVVVAHVIQPIDHIFAAITPRGARCTAHAQMDLPADQMQVLGDLAAGLAGTDDQHFSGRQQLRIFIVGGMDLVDLQGDTLRHARNGCILIAAGGHDHLVGGENADIRRRLRRHRNRSDEAE